MKDCRDCQWFDNGKCRQPHLLPDRWEYATKMRRLLCGPEAKYFEPKPPPVAWRDRIAMAWRILRGEVQPETKQDPPAYVVGQWSE